MYFVVFSFDYTLHFRLENLIFRTEYDEYIELKWGLSNNLDFP